jgi:glycine betaine/proline transport system substrate-binding protein
VTRRWTIGGPGPSRAHAALAMAAVLALTGCGGEKIASSPPGSVASSTGAGTRAACGTVNVAVNPWVGYEANAAVYSYVARTELGCTVVTKDLKEEVSWQGFGTGEVDLVLENWGHADLVKKYITDQKVALDLGSTGNKGTIGWYVPPWLAKEHPDVLDWKNLNRYADQFKTSESGGKGQLLDGDPSYVTNDAALIKNLGLNFSVVQGGSETALIQSFRQAEAQKKWFLAYFYEPQWFFNELPVVRVNLPARTNGCDDVPDKVACDYPPYDLNKVASVKFVNSASPAAALAKRFNWTNEDQNAVSRSIAVDKLSAQDAAKKWVEANPTKVAGWLATS